VALRSERILLTGGDSFTGRPLVDVLRQDGHEVVTVGRLEGEAQMAADLLDPDEIIDVIEKVQPTAIIHLAAMTFAPDQNLHRIYTTNVSGTASLLKGALECQERLRTVILPSSARVYAPPASADPIEEDYLLAPADHYGASKMAMEQVAQLFSNALPITITRPFNYTGPGQGKQFFVPKLVAAYVAREDVRVGNLHVARDFSDIRTVVEVYRRLVASPQPGKTFNICSGQPVLLGEIAWLLEEITGNRIELTVDPAFVRADEPEVITGSKRRLEAAIGPLPEPGIRKTLESMAIHLGGIAG